MKKVLKSIVRYLFISNYKKIKRKFYYTLKSSDINRALLHQNLENIHIFNYSKWHNGFCYFTATLNGKKVFIKVDTQLKLLKNEKTFYDIMEKEIPEYLIPMYGFYKDESLELIIFEFLENAQELNETLLLKNLNYLDDIMLILRKIKEKNIIHRDIKFDNFMVKDSAIKIIDFTFANSFADNTEFIELDVYKKKNFTILKALGTNLNPKDFVWNDFIALSEILSQIISSENINTQSKAKLKKYLLELKTLSLNTTYTKVIDKLEINSSINNTSKR